MIDGFLLLCDQCINAVLVKHRERKAHALSNQMFLSNELIIPYRYIRKKRTLELVPVVCSRSDNTVRSRSRRLIFWVFPIIVPAKNFCRDSAKKKFHFILYLLKEDKYGIETIAGSWSLLHPRRNF